MGNRTFLNIPTWIPGMILPMTFGLMTFRFGLRFLRGLFTRGKTVSTLDHGSKA